MSEPPNNPVKNYFEKIQRTDTVLGRTIKILAEADDIKGAFRFNLFTYDIEHAKYNSCFSPISHKGEIVSDNDAVCLITYLTKAANFSPSTDTINKAILEVSMSNTYHPIKDYLESLKWDGVPRLSTWLNKICEIEQNEYTAVIGRKLFLSLVARIYEPGIQYDQLIIFEGRQGIFKSRLVRAIGGNYYAPIELNVHDRKSLVDTMRGKWVLEVEELAGFSKQDRDKMKAFLSCPSDRVRLSYARQSIDFKRQCVFIGTLNPDGDNRYLNDDENRRFWPLNIPDGVKIKIEAFKEMRNQLFAEAVVLYRSGEPLWLEGDSEIKIAFEEQEARRSIDPWESIVEGWLLEKFNTGLLKEVSINDVLNECLKISSERINSGLSRRVGRIFSKMKWVRYRRALLPRMWCYRPPTEQDKVINDDWAE